MKKTSILPGLLGIIALCFTLMAFLFPLAPAALTGQGDVIYGYDLMFGNKAIAAFVTPIGAYIAVFCLFVIAAFFQIMGTAFGFRGGKFTGFLHILSAGSLIASAVLCFLVGLLVKADSVSLSLAWGFMATGVASAISGVLSGFIGFSSFASKKA